MQILFCDTLLSVRLIYYLKTALNVMRFVVPILLIIKLTIDIYKGILVANDKQEIIQKFSKRIIAAILVFLVPTFIGVLFSFMGTFSNEDANYQNNFLTCYNSANQELIDTLIIQEDEKLSKEEEERNKQTLINYANYQANAKNNEVNSQSNNGSYSSNLTDTTKQNGVYVKDGVFYIPSTDSGKNCPSNPKSEGYNNSYGYNNHFWTMLSSLIQASEKAGYKLKPSSQGCRSYSEQVRLKKEKGSIAATPGRSLHGFGIASDLTFYKDMSNACGSSRTMQNCPGMKWAHEHAKDYGLRFINSENWHIQPINYKRY